LGPFFEGKDVILFLSVKVIVKRDIYSKRAYSEKYIPSKNAKILTLKKYPKVSSVICGQRVSKNNMIIL